jgi:hypothetical protein
VGQLTKYREIGSPSVSLLEVYICEDGFFETQDKLPREVLAAISEKHSVITVNKFGYSIIFLQQNSKSEQKNDLSNYLGLQTLNVNRLSGDPIIHGAQPILTPTHSPFIELTAMLEGFVEQEVKAEVTTPGSAL